MSDWINGMPKGKINAWYETAKKMMNGNKSVDLSEAASIFNKLNVNVNQNRLEQIANIDGDKKVSIKEFAMALFMLDGNKQKQDTDWDGNIETKDEVGGELNTTMLNQTNQSNFEKDLAEVHNAFNQYEAEILYKEGNELSKNYRQTMEEFYNSGKNERNDEFGKKVFGENYKSCDFGSNPVTFELKDGTTVSREVFTNIITIKRNNEQIEEYDENNNLISLSRKLQNGNTEKYIDKDGDGYADVKSVNGKEEFLPNINEVKKRIGDDAAAWHFEVGSRVMQNILHDGTDGSKPLPY